MKLPTIGALMAGKAPPSSTQAKTGDQGKRTDFAVHLEDAKPVDIGAAGTGDRMAAASVPGAAVLKASSAMLPQPDMAIAVRASASASDFDKRWEPGSADAAGGYVFSVSSAEPAPPRRQSIADADAQRDPQAVDATSACAASVSSPTWDLMAFLLASASPAGTPARSVPPPGTGAPSIAAATLPRADGTMGIVAGAEEPDPPPSSPAAWNDASDERPLAAVRISDVTIVTHQGFSRQSTGRPTADASLPREPEADEAAQAASSPPSVVPAVTHDDVARRPPAMAPADRVDAPLPSFSRAPAPDAVPSNGFQQVFLPDATWRGDPTVARSLDAVVALASSADVAPDAGASSRVAPARSMVLQLAPDGLGTLSIRLHVSGSALDVSLDASDAKTTSLLEAHRDVLATALGDKDYRLQSLRIGTLDANHQGSLHDARTADPGASRDHDPHGGGAAGPDGRREHERKDRRQTSARRRSGDSAVVRGDPALFV